MSDESADYQHALQLQEKFDTEHKKTMQWYRNQVYRSSWIPFSHLLDYDKKLRRNEPVRQQQIALHAKNERERIRRARTIY
jgi:hypothetical protein